MSQNQATLVSPTRTFIGIKPKGIQTSPTKNMMALLSGSSLTIPHSRTSAGTGSPQLLSPTPSWFQNALESNENLNDDELPDLDSLSSEGDVEESLAAETTNPESCSSQNDCEFIHLDDSKSLSHILTGDIISIPQNATHSRQTSSKNSKTGDPNKNAQTQKTNRNQKRNEKRPIQSEPSATFMVTHWQKKQTIFNSMELDVLDSLLDQREVPSFSEESLEESMACLGHSLVCGSEIDTGDDTDEDGRMVSSEAKNEIWREAATMLASAAAFALTGCVMYEAVRKSRAGRR